MKIIRLVNIIILIIVYFGINLCNGQDFTKYYLRKNIDSIANEIANENIYKSSGVGYAGSRTEQWDRYDTLRIIATNDELIALTDHKSAVVRCYAFTALTCRKDVDVFPILLKHLNDTKSIRTFFGCILSEESLGDFFLNQVTPSYSDKDLYTLTKKQREIVDSILIFDKSIKIEHKNYLLMRLKPKEKYYERIKEIIKMDKCNEAYIALARFKNKNDIEIIKTLFDKESTEYFGIYAVREFPDTVFYPYLLRIFEKEWNNELYDYAKWKILYQALAKYPTKEETLKLFERTVNVNDEFRKEQLGMYMMVAIKKYPNQKFNSIKKRIKIDIDDKDELKEEMQEE